VCSEIALGGEQDDVGTDRPNSALVSARIRQHSARFVKNSNGSRLLLEQFRMRPGANKNDLLVVGAVDQQEISPNVAFAMISPVTV
jgi:hypothetical protein